MKQKLFILIFSTLFNQFINAQEFYVDAQKGDDNNKGLFQEPFKSISKAIQTANELTGKGSITIKLMPGLYALNNKVPIHPLRVFDDKTTFTIEAFIMPDDTNYTPEKMPVIQSFSINNSNTQFPHATGFLVSSNNVSIRGLKFIGNPNPEVLYYYPITREDPSLKNLEISQCYFIAEKNSTTIQGGIWAHGQTININHCIFSQCRNAILLFININEWSITNNIIVEADESAFWIGENNKDFTFQNNVISKCNYFWTNSSDSPQTFKFSNCVISENKHYLGKWDNKKYDIVEIIENNFIEINIVKTGEINLVRKTGANIPQDYLHIVSQSLGFNLKAGIFKSE